jgi:predicted peptidase
MLASIPLGMAALASAATRDNRAPALAPGKPLSAERLSRIEEFRRRSEGLEKQFTARRHKSDWVMPYRLFQPHAGGKLPLVVYLHGSGGLGDDNEKQLGLGNVFGSRVWALAENQHRFPCYVVAPQTDRGWIRYDRTTSDGIAKPIPGLGDGARLALEIIDELKKEFAIDDRRIYVTGQSMGGAGVWNLLTHCPRLFAAAVICCGGASTDDGTGSIGTPLWNFHGESDKTVPVSISRQRIAARRKAGGRPLSTEYEGVEHNVWQWAFTEPELVRWVFAQRRGA